MENLQMKKKKMRKLERKKPSLEWTKKDGRKRWVKSRLYRTGGSEHFVFTRTQIESLYLNLQAYSSVAIMSLWTPDSFLYCILRNEASAALQVLQNRFLFGIYWGRYLYTNLTSTVFVALGFPDLALILNLKKAISKD